MRKRTGRQQNVCEAIEGSIKGQWKINCRLRPCSWTGGDACMGFGLPPTLFNPTDVRRAIVELALKSNSRFLLTLGKQTGVSQSSLLLPHDPLPSQRRMPREKENRTRIALEMSKTRARQPSSFQPTSDGMTDREELES